MNGHPEYNESLYFNFHDTGNDVTAFMRIGNKPNKDEKSMFFFLMGEGFTLGMRAATPCTGSRTECAGLSFKLEGKIWRLDFQGNVYDFATNPPTSHPVSMDIAWEPLNPDMDYKECVDAERAAMSSNVASEHFEQFGHATGTLTVDGKAYSIDGSGERDRSEGVRDWGSPKMWMWINSVYNLQEGFNISKLTVEQGDVDAGYFYADGRNNVLNNAKIDVRMGRAGLESFSMVLKDKSGKEYPVEGKVIRFAMLPMAGSKDMMLVETISETVWNGKIGHGIAEFLVPVPKH